jgi:hypothetical protein
MSRRAFCFVVMPFRPEFNYFYLYLQRHLYDKHGLRVERGDHQILTKPLMDKIREKVVEADVLLAEITSSNPNVFYEVGLAHAFGKPVIFLTQDDPSKAPVDIRQFEFIEYELSKHEDFLVKLDNAIQNVFVGKYRDLYSIAADLLKKFNAEAGSSYPAASREEFQARVMRSEQSQGIPPVDAKGILAEFLLPKILKEATDVMIMKKVMEWTSRFQE